jgi:MSHA pilin protein MshA
MENSKGETVLKHSIKKQSGFTLIELVVVIVVLGILAATALPRFVNLSGEARAAAKDGLRGAVSTAMSLAYAKAVASGQAGATGSLTIDGQTITLAHGYPNLATIDNMLKDAGDSTYDELTGVWTVGGVAACTVTYTAATSATAPATVAAAADGSC